MSFVKNCGYEFDNEKTFVANKKMLLRSAGRLQSDHLNENDVGEE